MKKAISLCFPTSMVVALTVLLVLVAAWTSQSAAIAVSQANVRFNGDEEGGDAFGYSVSSAGDFNGDGYDDVIVGQFIDEVAYIFYGQEAEPISRTEIDASDADIKFIGPYGSSRFGFSVACAGDFNGDGYDDVIIGDPQDGYFESGAGSAYVFFGGDYPEGTDFIAWEADRIIRGEEFGDDLGWSVASAGHFNDDEFDDIIIGAPGATITGSGRSNSGAVFVFYGDHSSGPIEIYADDFDDCLSVGQYEGDRCGLSVTHAGDFNGDGWDDVIVGCPYHKISGEGWVPDTFPGQILLFLGNNAGFAGTSLGGGTSGESDGDEFGFSVAGVGDVNRDGFDDIIVGAPGASVNDGFSEVPRVGRAYIILGRPQDVLFPILYNERNASATYNGVITLLGENASDHFGFAVGGAGNFGVDAFADVIVGAPLGSAPSPSEAPRVYIFPGREAAIDSHVILNASSDAGWTFVGEASNHRLGHAVSGMFNWNNDDFPDVIFGAPGNDSAYMFFGLTIQAYPLSGPGFPASIINNTNRLARGSPFYLKAFDVGTIGLYFIEPGDEQQLQWWGDIPFDASVSPGKSVTLSIPWPVCDQEPSETQVICKQPSYKASLFWTFQTTVDGQYPVYAFPADTQAPPPEEPPPLLPLDPDDAGVCNFQLFAFASSGTLVGDAKVFSVPPAVASVDFRPKEMYCCYWGLPIRAIMELPEGYNERDIERDSLRLSIPACPDCEPISALWGLPLKKRYMAFFPRRELIDLLENMDLESVVLRVSGHLKEGARFEGDGAIRVKCR